MTKIFCPAILMTGLFLGGCASQPEPAPAPPSVMMDEATLSALRTSLGEGVSVGRVDRILPDRDFLALRDVNTADFPVGTSVALIDSNAVTLGHGKVVAIVGGEAHVEFQVAGPRRPAAGDAGVAFLKAR